MQLRDLPSVDELARGLDDPQVALETVLDAFRAGDGAPSPHAPHKADAQ